MPSNFSYLYIGQFIDDILSKGSEYLEMSSNKKYFPCNIHEEKSYMYYTDKQKYHLLS